MPISREVEPAYYRPLERRLVNLSNEELRAIYDLRVAKVHHYLDPRGFCENNKIVYWSNMMPAMTDLYEVLMEIQARYPKEDVEKYGFDDRLLPLNEKQWVIAYLSKHKINGLRQA